MIPSEPDDREVLAGEYVIGLLDPDQTAEVAAALPTDPDLARRVAFWEERLLPLATGLPRGDVPNQSVWDRIERDLQARGSNPAAVDLLRRAAARRSIGTRLWRSLPAWRAATALAAAAALVLALLPRDADRADASTRFFAVLQSRDAGGREVGPGWLIQIAQDGTVRSLPLDNVDPGSGRVLQLWTLWDQARGPVSLGLLPPGGSIRLPPERLPVIGGGQLFEITLEPSAGSPTGRPTGRIMFIGRATPSASQVL